MNGHSLPRRAYVGRLGVIRRVPRAAAELKPALRIGVKCIQICRQFFDSRREFARLPVQRYLPFPYGLENVMICKEAGGAQNAD